MFVQMAEDGDFSGVKLLLHAVGSPFDDPSGTCVCVLWCVGTMYATELSLC